MADARAIQQHAYLQAMGIPLYVSRRSLPGAAASHRRPLPSQRSASAVPPAVPTTKDFPATKDVAAVENAAAAASPLEGLGEALGPVGRRPAADDRQAETERAAAAGPQPRTQPVARFSVVAVIAGPFLWLEDMPQGVVSRDQVALIQAMATALGARGNQPRVTQFDWPPHQNRQLDLGEEAARAALSSFVSRQVEQQSCEAVILLGADCRQRVGELPADLRRVATAGTREMLATPAVKREVWRDLRALRRRV
jgi:hypothetical protein